MANERVTRDIIINYTESNAEVVKDTIKTIDRMIQNRQLNRYWKDQNALINDVTNSYEKYNKTLNKMDATELVKSFNALKALSGIKELDISQLLPNFDKVEGKVKELIKSIDLNEAFGVDAFNSAFKVFDMLKTGGIDLQDFFKRFDLDIDTQNLQKSLRLAEKEIQRVKNELVEKDMKIDSLISGSGFSELQSQLERANDELSSLKSNATEVFKQFLRSNGFDDYFTSFKDDKLFRPYIEEIEKGYITSTQAITQFKLANRDLLQDFNKNTENGFNTEQLNLFLSKLEEIFKQTQAISENINNIMTNGVMTKAMQNLSVDDTISQSQRDLFANVLKDEEALSSIAGVLKKIIDESVTLQSVNNKTFDEEQFNRLLILFEKIESSLSSMKAIFADVGDGEEFSPLLNMINKIDQSIKEMNVSVKGIGLNMNIDVGSNKELEAKLQEKTSKALLAYQKLFNQLKNTGAGGSIINQKFFEFDINQFDTMMSKVEGYRKFIENMRNEAKSMFNGKDVLFQDIDKSFLTGASGAYGQITKIFNELKASSDVNPLKNLFGETDLSGVVEQLNRIIEKLGEISTTALEFKNTFKDGFNVSASVEEIEKLTSRVKELEDELSKVKVSSISPVKTNISSGNGVVKELETINAKEDEIISKTQKMYRAFNSIHGVSGNGISWFTDELETAESYIESRGKDRIAQLVTDTNKFLTIDGNGSSFNKILYEGIERTTDELAEMAKQAGYAGIAINNIYDSFSGSTDIKPSNIFAIFDENIIKKATDVTETIRVEASIKNINSLISETNEKLELEKNNQKELNALLDDYNNGRKISPEDKNYIENGTLQKSLEDSIKASETYERKLESLNSELSKLQSSTPIKDTFQGGTSEASKMEEVATATTDAVQAKKDFANANERVQASVDNSKSKLELESELMEEVAKSADKATKAKDKYSKRSKISEDTYTGKSDVYASIANQKLNNSGYTILGESVSTELENGLVKVSAKIKNADGIWKTFSAKIDADGNMFEQRFRTVTNGIEKLENELRNFDRESTNSVNRVNKTFADIDVPKESFDDIIAKFNIIEEKAKNIVKITRSDVQNNDGTYSTSYTARYKDGSNEILGESSDPQLLRRTNVLYDTQQAAKESNKAYKELIKTIQNYSEVQKRIAKNEAFDGDLALAQKLRDEITELQKQPILSSTQLEEANKRLVKLRLQVEKIKEQTQQTTQSKVDKALISQLSAWKKIQKIRLQIAKTDSKDTENLHNLNEQKKSFQKQYIEAGKVLKANKDLYNQTEQQAKLDHERLETNEKINNFKATKHAEAWEKNLKAIQEYMDANTKLNKLMAKDKGTGKHASDIARQEKEVEKLKESAIEAKVALSSMVNPHEAPIDDWNKWIEAMEKFEQATKGSVESVAKLEDALRSARNAQLSSIDSTINNSQSKLDDFSARKAQSDAYKNSLIELGETIERLRTLRASLSNTRAFTDEEKEQIDALTQSIRGNIKEIQRMSAGEKGSDALSRTKLANRIHEYMDKNTRMTREFREEFENLIRILRSGDDSVNIKDIARQFEDIKFRVKEAKLEGISFFDIFKNKVVYGFAARLAQYYLSFYDWIRYARYAVQSVIEFDTALTEMRKVSDESVSTLERLQKATFDLADGVGTTALELQKSVADFMRIGESLEDATKSAQDANVLFRVSEFDDVTQATDALIAMSAAYKDLEKSQINDVLNEIGNNYAISTDELASALQKSAATLSVAGNDIYEAAALVTAGNTVLQDADSVGTGKLMPEYIVICRYFIY